MNQHTFTLVRKFIHFTRIDCTILLATGETNNTQTAEVQRCYSLCILACVHFSRDRRDKLELRFFVFRGNLWDNSKLACIST